MRPFLRRSSYLKISASIPRSNRYFSVPILKPEQIVISEHFKQLQTDEVEAEAFNPLYEYIDVYRPILLQTDELYRTCATKIIQYAEENDRSWVGIDMSSACNVQFEQTLPKTKHNLATVDDGLCKFLYQVKLYTDSLYLKCYNLNATLAEKDEDIKELKVIVTRKVERIQELQKLLDEIENNNTLLKQKEKHMQDLLRQTSRQNETIVKELEHMKAIHDKQSKALTELQVKVAELKKDNQHFIEKFDFTEEERQNLIDKIEGKGTDGKLLTDEISKLKEKNIENTINLSNKSNTVEQQEQDIKKKDQLLDEMELEVKKWRQQFHATDKLLIRWKISFVSAVMMLAFVVAVLYDHIQSMTMMKVFKRCKVVGQYVTSILPSGLPFVDP
eukprot:449200_1